jgi:hypothetical protein
MQGITILLSLSRRMKGNYLGPPPAPQEKEGLALHQLYTNTGSCTKILGQGYPNLDPGTEHRASK